MKTILILLALTFAASVGATTHIVKFGGRKYTPSSLTVAVGDTIVWQGDFSEHSLSLMKAPAGAQIFKNIEKGTTFRYVVRVAGSYAYECDDHVDEGMVGSFNAVAAK
jgi:plastocyanin